MTRQGWLRLMAAGVLVVWLCLFLHWDNTEKSMIRALLVETNGDSWTVGLLYQFPEASADSSEAKAAIRLCIGRGPELSSAISAAEEALPQRADWRLCEYLLAGLDSVRRTVTLPEDFDTRQACRLCLPVDASGDRIYVNGKEVMHNLSYAADKTVTIEAGLLHPGDNVLSALFYITWGTGGIGKRQTPCCLETAGGDRFDLLLKIFLL